MSTNEILQRKRLRAVKREKYNKNLKIAKIIFDIAFFAMLVSVSSLIWIVIYIGITR